MNFTVVTTIALTGFTIAFLHAAIPTHWLPFVLTGRVQKWSRGKTLLVTAVCGSGHVLFTAALGFLVAWLGFALNDRVGAWFPRIAAVRCWRSACFTFTARFPGMVTGTATCLAGMTIPPPPRATITNTARTAAPWWTPDTGT